MIFYGVCFTLAFKTSLRSADVISYRSRALFKRVTHGVSDPGDTFGRAATYIIPDRVSRTESLAHSSNCQLPATKMPGQWVKSAETRSKSYLKKLAEQQARPFKRQGKERAGRGVSV